MNEIIYGGIKKSYGVTVNTDGRIAINVYHENKKMRVRIRANKACQQYFLRYLGFPGSNPRAKYWMSRVVNEYSGHFSTGSVDFYLK